MLIGKLLKPTNDYVFKRIFGYVGNEDITKALLMSILENINIKNITLDCKEILEQDLRTDKFGILDIRAIIDESIQCNIEMQIVDRKDIENRLLFYWSKLYAKTINLGEQYITAQKTILILFVDYEISALEQIHKYLSKWHICEDEYKNVILTKNLEIYIIELPKFKKFTNNTELSNWVKFIINPEVIKMSEINNNEALKKANAVLQNISNDEREQELAFKRELYIMDQKAIEAAGFDKGLEQGKKEEKIKIAKKLLEQNIDIDIIIEATGLTKKEIENLEK